MAWFLRGLGVGPESLVGVCCERGVDLLVVVLGVLKAGAGYVPLDPGYPVERLGWVVADSGVSVVVTQEGLVSWVSGLGADRVVCVDSGWDEVVAAGGDGPVSSGVVSSNVAYGIYTSGSTGRPKGVLVPHSAIVNRLVWMQDRYRLGPGDRVLHKTPIGFDVSVWELLWPLLAGAGVVMARPGGHREPDYLAGLIVRERVSTVHFVPSMLAEFLEHPDAAAAMGVLRQVFCSGEALPAGLVDRFYDVARAALAPGSPVPRLHNLYGPTETAVDVTHFQTRPGLSRVPIGHPVWNTTTHILGPDLTPVPDGETGELYLGGIQLARGYHNHPALTATRFIATPTTETTTGTDSGSDPDAGTGAGNGAGTGGGGRLYRTGDLARRLEDGAVEYLGRTDNQVKIRGARIELDEISNALTTHPAITHAATTHHHGHLTAYTVPATTATTLPTDTDIRTHLATTLPPHALPHTITWLTHLPTTPNGKTDHTQLTTTPTITTEATTPEKSTTDTTTGTTPSTDSTASAESAESAVDNLVVSNASASTAATGGSVVEGVDPVVVGVVVSVWAEVLGVAVSAVPVEGDFFELGGDSLLGLRVLSRLRAEFGVVPASRVLFDYPTPLALARHLHTLRAARAARGGGVPGVVGEAGIGTAATTDTDAAADAGSGAAAGVEAGVGGGPVVPVSGVVGLSGAQERFWFAFRYEPGSAEYTVSRGFAVRGVVDVEALRVAVARVVARHEPLRTVIRVGAGDVPVPVVVAAEEAVVPFVVRDVSGIADRGVREAQVQRELAGEVNAPFDVGTGPVLRSLLVRVAAREWVWVFSAHHAVIDGWSLGLFTGEVSALYTAITTGRHATLPALPARYADYPGWHHKLLGTGVRERELAYWRRQLAEVVPLQIPADFPRPRQRRGVGATVRAVLDTATTTELQRYGQARGATLFMVLAAACHSWLARHSGQHDIALGTATSGREHPDFEPVIGCFINTVVLRTRSTPAMTFPDLLATTRDTVLAALAHRHTPFQDLVEELQPDRDPARTPLTQAIMVLQNGPDPTLHLPGLHTQPHPLPTHTSITDLTLEFTHHHHQLHLTLHYNTDLFHPTTAHHLTHRLTTLLTHPPHTPDTTPHTHHRLLTPHDHHTLHHPNTTQNTANTSAASGVPPHWAPTLHQQIEHHAHHTPHHTAITTPTHTLTYHHLNTTANQLAHHHTLHHPNTTTHPEHPIAHLLTRTHHTITAQLATLKTGNTYLPLHTTHPPPRLHHLLHTTNTTLIITDKA
ncbi:amino acid adenylation domain-containing protein, partial [Amycolatopsis minnesotensis]|uniref:amino acid adenylation domain-containing protein n=1 Tax=Amycolatopsis minnesotensis TaxID=337894 RepID=UPI0031E37E15